MGGTTEVIKKIYDESWKTLIFTVKHEEKSRWIVDFQSFSYCLDLTWMWMFYAFKWDNIISIIFQMKILWVKRRQKDPSKILDFISVHFSIKKDLWHAILWSMNTRMNNTAYLLSNNTECKGYKKRVNGMWYCKPHNKKPPNCCVSINEKSFSWCSSDIT